jgi:hypothetical protein
MPRRRSEIGVTCFSLVSAGPTAAGITGAEVKVSMALPAGISRGNFKDQPMVNRYFNGLFYSHRSSISQTLRQKKVRQTGAAPGQEPSLSLRKSRKNRLEWVFSYAFESPILD